WLKVVREFGAQHGLAREATLIEGPEDGPGVLSAKDRARILALRKDPYLSALLAAEMLKRDASDIGTKLGRDLTTEEVYLAHFLGPYDAYKFLNKVDSEPKAVAAKLLPKPARANRPIFFARSGHRSKSLSVAEVHKKIEQSMGLRLDRYRNVADTVPTATAYAQ
ncbi:MAG: transglycosylase domain protein, partial [Hyphomicrobiales bacterium]|nr:transglycosylase domain protein [Hyphomicrobiales bacterium]